MTVARDNDSDDDSTKGSTFGRVCENIKLVLGTGKYVSRCHCWVLSSILILVYTFNSCGQFVGIGGIRRDRQRLVHLADSSSSKLLVAVLCLSVASVCGGSALCVRVSWEVGHVHVQGTVPSRIQVLPASGHARQSQEIPCGQTVLRHLRRKWYFLTLGTLVRLLLSVTLQSWWTFLSQVFLIAQITSFPGIPSNFANMPPVLVLVLVETGLPGIAIVLTFGQLISQIFVEEFTLPFMNLYGKSNSQSVCHFIDWLIDSAGSACSLALLLELF